MVNRISFEQTVTGCVLRRFLNSNLKRGVNGKHQLLQLPIKGTTSPNFKKKNIEKLLLFLLWLFLSFIKTKYLYRDNYLVVKQIKNKSHEKINY
jgi:hypothetical protein